jgi:MFS family permease
MGRGTPAHLIRSRFATAVVFLLLGIVLGTVASRMPQLKAQAGVSDGLLGLALLGIPLGSIIAVQVTGRWIARRGSSAVTNAGVILMCVSIAVLAAPIGFVSLLAALTLVGIGIGLTDTGMNTHAVTVERGYRRPIMSSFHGFASLGMLLGTLAGAVAARFDLAPAVHFPVVGVLALAIGLGVRTSLLPGSADAHSHQHLSPAGPSRASRRAPWNRTLVLLATIALLAWMTEHAISDWSAVYLRDHLGTSSSVATYGFALFALFMVLMRFLADRLTARLGPALVLRVGGLVAGAGLAAGLATDSAVGAIIGCGLVGVGMAGIVPVVFTAAGNLPGVNAGNTVSKVAGVAFAGSLIGPPLIGLVADLTSLRTALFLVAAAALAIGLAGPAAVRPARRA